MAPSDPASTLHQLESFLAQDAGNDTLRAEAFLQALRAGLIDRARVHLEAGIASSADPLAWGLRDAHWLIAGRRWADARARLRSLRGHADAPRSLIDCTLHDEAYVAMQQGEYAQGLALLEPLLNAGTPIAPVQALALRLLHHADRLDEAMRLASTWAQQRALGPEATGVAALAALDFGDLPASKAWADAALAHDARHLEALVARASVALAEQAPRDAGRWLDTALQRAPEDGRARSALGFTRLLEGRLADAETEFRRALANMPGHIGTWHGLGWAALLQGALPQALVAFEEALALDRNFAESHGGLAVVHALQGERAKAEEAMRRATRLDAGCMSAAYAQALLDGSAQDPQAVRALARELLSRPRPRQR